MRAVVSAAQITPPVSCHGLRHSFASLLAKNRVSLSAVAALLGHSEARMTERRSAQLAPDSLSKEPSRALPGFTIHRSGSDDS
jgi:integrase